MKYTGEYYFGGRLCANTTPPPIIDKLLFVDMQKRLAKNKIFSGRKFRKTVSSLRSF